MQQNSKKASQPTSNSSKSLVPELYVQTPKGRILVQGKLFDFRQSKYPISKLVTAVIVYDRPTQNGVQTQLEVQSIVPGHSELSVHAVETTHNFKQLIDLFERQNSAFPKILTSFEGAIIPAPPVQIMDPNILLIFHNVSGRDIKLTLPIKEDSSSHRAKGLSTASLRPLHSFRPS